MTTTWYLPTFYGDIRLTVKDSSTQIEWENLSPTERQALETLQRKAIGNWPTASPADTPYRITDKGDVLVSMPIAKVVNILARGMKWGRKLLTAVTFSGGKIEEVRRGDGEAPAALANSPKAAVTVAQPTRGCPIPEFERAEILATRVLKEFLSPTQLVDFERTQSFIVVGADSGHRYMLISRHSPSLHAYGGRSVYDVTEGQSICVHDWLVPASEELLELALFLGLPGRERYVRALPEA